MSTTSIKQTLTSLKSKGEKITQSNISTESSNIESKVKSLSSAVNSKSNSVTNQLDSSADNTNNVNNTSKSLLKQVVSTIKNSTIGSVEDVDALPELFDFSKKDSDINNYYLKLILTDKSKDATLIITGFCPETLSLSFSNRYEPINLGFDGSSVISAGVQTLSGHTMARRLQNLRVWKTGEPLKMSVDFQLYATHAVLEDDLGSIYDFKTKEERDSKTKQVGEKLTPIKLLKIVQELAGLALPSYDASNKFLIAPGPSPVTIRYNALKTTESADGKVSVVKIKQGNKEVNARTKETIGVSNISVDIQYGNFFRVSNVLITGVKIDIPYSLGQNKEKSKNMSNKLEQDVRDEVANREPNKSDKESADNRVATATTAKEKTEANLATATKNYEEKEENLADAQSRKENADKDVVNAQTAVKESTKALETAGQERAKALQEVDNLDPNPRVQAEELEKARQAQQTAEANYQNNEQRIKDLSAKEESLKDEIKDLGKQFDKANEKIQDNKEDIKELQEDMKEYDRKATEYAEKAKEQEASVTAAKKARDTAKTEYDNANKALNSAKTSYEDNNNILNISKSSIKYYEGISKS